MTHPTAIQDLTDIQWCALDILLRAKQKGCAIVSRKELLHASALPDAVKVKLVFAMLVMPDGLVNHHGNDFEISPAGESLYMLKHGTKGASRIPDTIISLPDRSHEVLQ